MVEWILQNPGWTTLGVIVVILAIFGVLSILLFAFTVRDMKEVDEKYYQEKMARHQVMKQIYDKE